MSDSILSAQKGDYVVSDLGRPATVHEVHSDGLTLAIEYQSDGVLRVGHFHIGWKLLQQIWNLGEPPMVPIDESLPTVTQ